MFKEKVQVTSLDVDGNRELKLSSLFQMMQIVASNHVDKNHIGHLELAKDNVIWVVFRFEVKIFRTPTLNEILTVTTHAGQNKGFVFPRFFEIYDQKENLVVSSSSMWAIVDKTTRKVVVHASAYDVVKAEADKNDLPLPGKVEVKDLSKVEDRKVRYTEIDLNGHLNNTQYIEYMLDTHDFEFYKNHRISSILINYDKEIRSGETVTLLSDGKSPETISGMVGDSNRFTARLEYEER